MAENAAIREKWDRIYAAAEEGVPEPAKVLAEHVHLLPQQGDACELACGLGGNALMLAQRGLRTRAWDISPVAIQRITAMAEDQGLAIDAEVRDVETASIPRNAFDVVVVSRFLSRAIVPSIADSLKVGGVLFYQTYTRDKLSAAGPCNPDYLLARNELIRLFSGLRLVYYREDGYCGDLSRGARDEAYFIAQKA